MRVAALYDIHANLPALEAVLAEVRRERVDQIVLGGDVVPGPLPRETAACLRSLDMPVLAIHGNGDREVLNERARRPVSVPAAFRWLIEHSAEQLNAEDEQWMTAWPATLRLNITGIGETLFCHATPRNDEETFTRLTSEEKLRPIFDPCGVPLVVCGHTHMQHDRRVGWTRVVNAGSVGMPFGDPGAYWLLLGPGVELKRTDYDRETAMARFHTSAYWAHPQAGPFAAQNILQPPSEQQMLEIFSRAELRP
jgi:putative phosphoesterase